MKRLQLLIFLFCVTSCFASVKRHTSIVLDRTIVSSLDSLNVIDSLKDRSFENGIKVDRSRSNYYFSSFKKGMRIALKFKDGRTYLADRNVIGVDNQKVIIKMRYNKPIFHQYSRFELVTPIMIIALIVILITKLPVAMSVLKPDSKKLFFMRCSLLNLSLIVLFTIQLSLNIFSLPLFFLQILLFPVIIDYLFLWLFYRRMKKSNLILTSVISNFVFNTIGLFMIYYIVAKFDL